MEWGWEERGKGKAQAHSRRESPLFLLLISLFYYRGPSWEPRKAERKNMFSSPGVENVKLPIVQSPGGFQRILVYGQWGLELSGQRRLTHLQEASDDQR